MKLSLTYPVNPVHINQKFGDNPQLYADPKYGDIKGHNGIDFQASHGQPVYAAHDGVCYPEIDNNGGNGVVIRTHDVFDYQGQDVYYKSIYWHLTQDDAVVHTGQEVKAGDLIGYADNTGASTGDHLHFGLKPQAKNEDNGAWYNVEQQNGYLGAIDPLPYFPSDLTPEQAQVLQAEVSGLQKLVQLLIQKFKDKFPWKTSGGQ